MKAIALLLAIGAAVQAPDDTSRVVAQLDAYLEAYEPRLSELVADERMDQMVATPQRVLLRGVRDVRKIQERRQLRSEVAFIALPHDAGWLGFRHVKTVNNKPVALKGESLTASLTMEKLDAARALLRASAKHNLGLARTTNLPNLPLEFLHARNRHRLEPLADGREKVRGIETSRIVFKEHATPTLVGNPSTGADMPSLVRAWVDQNGRLLRAEVNTFTYANALDYEHLVRVDFEEFAALGMLVPAEMHEEFPVPRPGVGTAVATYTNFRRFQTSGRIVPQ